MCRPIRPCGMPSPVRVTNLTRLRNSKGNEYGRSGFWADSSSHHFYPGAAVNFVIKRVRRRLEDQKPEEESVTQLRRQAQATPAPLPTPRTSRNRVRESQAPIVLPPLARSHFTKRSLLGTPRDVRRGIILMTILGPCRAFDPPD